MILAHYEHYRLVTLATAQLLTITMMAPPSTAIVATILAIPAQILPHALLAIMPHFIGKMTPTPHFADASMATTMIPHLISYVCNAHINV